MKILFGREAPFKDIGVECRIALLARSLASRRHCLQFLNGKTAAHS